MAFKLKFMEKNVYENLDRIDGNRPFNPRKTNKFLRTIVDNGGKLPENGQWPLTINAKSQILDGQNHWLAIMNWNKKHPKEPIEKVPYYLITDGNLDTAKSLNQGDERWKDSDLISSWSELGHTDFTVLKEILATTNAKKVTRGIVYKICGNPDIVNLHKTIVDGTFKMWRKRKDAEAMIDYLARVKSQLTKLYGPSEKVIPIFLACTRIPDIDMDHFCRQLKQPTASVCYSISTDDILETFTRVYNAGKGSHTRKHLNIADEYTIVKGYNAQQEKNKYKEPQLREEAIAKGRKAGKEKAEQAKANATILASNIPKHDELRDDGIVPV